MAVVASLALVGNNQPKELNNLSGTTNYDTLDVTDGYLVDGTTLIDGNGALTITATTTLTKSPDGFVAFDDFTVATGTAKAVFTNNFTTDLMCDADSAFIDVVGTSQAPSIIISLGTTTSATGYATGLLASTTLATTTSPIIPLTYAVPFKLANGNSIVGALSDNNGIISSSTNYSNWDIDFGIHCWSLEG